ncbi:hypothetical protein LVB87_02660 [Lysobacter sp. KIS68-7]|uniref:hypothetical protein n=1 Tax=Lysobacter sp. KIS68-7 TaxID=2904252 RepID=UPI001E3FF40C|nr:hypothetical protein [Lysobacter sp. KIS68-7]UHQ20079.1 hypothetical protein LVB87_02660 [Lysobacter sp. KIS68-7]
MRPAFAPLFAGTVLLALATPAFAQAQPDGPPPQPVVTTVPPAKDADVATLDGLMAALYDVISGPAGQARDWNRMRSLFIPGGRMMPVGGKTKDVIGIRLMTVNDYVATSGPLLLEKGFQERELARKVERFGNIATVFSTYEAYILADGHVLRGINTLQLMFDGKRWWIVSLMWQAESPDLPLPKAYLPEGK